jgi:hypothetical protein
MGTRKLRIGDIFRQRFRNKVVEALAEEGNALRAVVNLRCSNQSNYLDTSYIPTSSITAAKIKKCFEAAKRTVPFLLSLIVSILIVLLNVTGCSDNPYTGSMLQPGDVDNYIFSHGDGRICLTNGVETACLTLVPKRRDGTLPIIYIYSSSIAYVFNHEGVPIIRAERETDTSDIIKEITGGTVTQLGGGGQTPGGNTGGGNNGGTPPNNGGTPPGSGQTPGDNTGGGNNGGTPPNNGGTPPGSGQTPGDNTGGGNNGGTPPNNGGTPPGSGQTPGDNTGGGNNGGAPPNNDGTPPNDDSPPNNIVSHYVFSNPPNNLRGDEWIVWIYYPDDYSGPSGLPNSPEGYGFTITVDGGETTEFAQVTGGERGSGVRLVIRTDQPETLITITWNPPYTDLSATFTLKSDIDLTDYDL